MSQPLSFPFIPSRLRLLHTCSFLPYDYKPGSNKASSLETEMSSHFSAETTAWMLAEMAENRDKRKVRSYYITVYAAVARLTVPTIMCVVSVMGGGCTF